jgi:hypothetical protein
MTSPLKEKSFAFAVEIVRLVQLEERVCSQ